jgi:acyl dehydratase
MGLNHELEGKRYRGPPFAVTAESIAAYARATNDGNETYLGPAPVASPVFPVVPAFPTFMAAAEDPELGADLMRLVHIAESHVIHRPLRPGDLVAPTSELEAVAAEEGGESFTIRADLALADGTVACEARARMVIRASGRRRRRMGVPNRGERPPVVFEQDSMIEEDQPRRYADASGDRNPIHLSEDAARAAKLPGVILHGMCTMAMAVKGAVDGLAAGDPTRVRRAELEFFKPVFPGQSITTRFWEVGAIEGASEYGFEVTNRHGVGLTRAGLVEISVLNA